jgi:hypothetical protein
LLLVLVLLMRAWAPASVLPPGLARESGPTSTAKMARLNTVSALGLR